MATVLRDLCIFQPFLMVLFDRHEEREQVRAECVSRGDLPPVYSPETIWDLDAPEPVQPLVALYDEIAAEPLPEDMMELLDRLDDADQ